MAIYRRFYNNGYPYVFFTIVTNNRIPILINNIDLLRSSFIYAKQKYNFEICSAVVLKDHLHIIINLEDTKTYPEIIRLIKYYFSIHINRGHAEALPTLQISESKIKKREKGIWQRRYWEHTIRDEKDLYRHIDYIHYNPIKHGFVTKAIDYPYSSFEKFVSKGYYDKDWCNFEDKNKVNELDYE